MQEIEGYLAARKLLRPYLDKSFDFRGDNKITMQARKAVNQAAVIKFECRAVQVCFLPMCDKRREKLDKLEAELSATTKQVPSDVVNKFVWQAVCAVPKDAAPAGTVAGAAPAARPRRATTASAKKSYVV